VRTCSVSKSHDDRKRRKNKSKESKKRKPKTKTNVGSKETLYYYLLRARSLAYFGEGGTKNSFASTPLASTEPVEGRDVNRGIAMLPPPAPAPFRLGDGPEIWILDRLGEEEEWRVDDLFLDRAASEEKRRERKKEDERVGLVSDRKEMEGTEGLVSKREKEDDKTHLLLLLLVVSNLKPFLSSSSSQRPHFLLLLLLFLQSPKDLLRMIDAKPDNLSERRRVHSFR